MCCTALIVEVTMNVNVLPAKSEDYGDGGESECLE
jgi:hypothetical protein